MTSESKAEPSAANRFSSNCSNVEAPIMIESTACCWVSHRSAKPTKVVPAFCAIGFNFSTASKYSGRQNRLR